MVTVRGLVAGKNVHNLIDTGSVVTLVNEEILRDCSTVTRTTAANKLVITANGEPLELVGTAEIPIIIQKEVVRLVAKNIMQECILGADFLQALKCVIDLNNNTLHLNGKVIPLVTLPGKHQPVNVIANERVDGEWTPQDGIQGEIRNCCGSFTSSCTSSVIQMLNPLESQDSSTGKSRRSMTNSECLLFEECERSPAVSSVIRQMIDKAEGLTHQEELSIISSDSIDLGRSKLVKHKINTGDAIPVKQPFRQILFHHC